NGNGGSTSIRPTGNSSGVITAAAYSAPPGNCLPMSTSSARNNSEHSSQHNNSRFQEANMYDRSQWYIPLVQRLKEQDEDGVLKGKQYVLLLRVELGLWLLERLGLVDEPITVLWVLLSGLPIPDSRLDAFDQQQRHAVANARVLLPFSGRFNWESALREY